MTNITVRDIPEAIYQKIKQEAVANKRSINSEIIYGLEQNYGNPKQDKQAILVTIKASYCTAIIPVRCLLFSFITKFLSYIGYSCLGIESSSQNWYVDQDF